jgi:hypothetical protein
MSDFFKWVASLPEEQAWALFVGICLVMALIPYGKKLKKRLGILFRSEKPKIVDFSWRHSPDHAILNVGSKTYYLHANGKAFIMEGGAIQLNWNVKGAYQIDILPVAKNVKGNGLTLTASVDQRAFTLVAHTWKGKITRTISFEADLFRTLNTLEWKAVFSTEPTYPHFSVGQNHSISWKKLFEKATQRIKLAKEPGSVIYAKTETFDYEASGERALTNSPYLSKANKQILYFNYHPKRYNDALKGENQIPNK